jgi:hypothetical protein
MSKLKIALSITIAALLSGAVVGTAGPSQPRPVARNAQAPAPSPSLEASVVPSVTSQPRLAPQPGQQAAVPIPPPVIRPCLLRGNGLPINQCWCPPPYVESPSRIPCSPPCTPVGAAGPQLVIPCPPVPPPPAPGQPAIWLCPSPLILQPAPGTGPSRGTLLCGRGFHPNELVTVTATSARGVVSWSATANPTGSLVTSLWAPLCRLAPVTLTAVGAQGDRSNSLVVPGPACL